jgi:hypothetical protein
LLEIDALSCIQRRPEGLRQYRPSIDPDLEEAGVVGRPANVEDEVEPVVRLEVGEWVPALVLVGLPPEGAKLDFPGSL